MVWGLLACGLAWAADWTPRQVSVSPDGHFAAMADDQNILVWRLSDGVLVGDYPFPEAVLYDDLQLASNGTLVANARSRSLVITPDGSSRVFPGSAYLNRDGTQLLVGGAREVQMQVLALPSFSEVRVVPLVEPLDIGWHAPWVTPDLKFVLADLGDEDERWSFIDASTGAVINVFKIDKEEEASLSPDGKRVAVFRHGESFVDFLDVASKKKIKTIKVDGLVEGVSWPDDPATVVIATSQNLEVWAVDGEESKPQHRHRSGTLYASSYASEFYSNVYWTGVDVSPDGKHIFGAGTSTGTVVFASVEGGKLIGRNFDPKKTSGAPPVGGLGGLMEAARLNAPPPLVPVESLPPVGEWTVPNESVDFEVKLPAGMTWVGRAKKEGKASIPGSTFALQANAFVRPVKAYPTATVDDLVAAYIKETFSEGSKFTKKTDLQCKDDGGLRFCAVTGSMKAVVAIGTQIILVTPIGDSPLRGGLITVSGTTGEFGRHKGLLEEMFGNVRTRVAR